MEPPNPLPAEALPVLRDGINLTLSRWSALQMAVDNEWGGRNSVARANQLSEDIFNWFNQSSEPLYIDDLEDMLEEGLVALNTEAQDGSIGEVADKLMILHEECAEGNYTSVENLREACAHRTVPSHVRQVADDDDDSGSDTDSMGEVDAEMMLVDATRPSTAPVQTPTEEQGPVTAAEADDGWTTVGSRRSRGRNH